MNAEATHYYYTLPESLERRWTLLATGRGVSAVLFGPEELEAEVQRRRARRPGAALAEDASPFEEFGVLDRLRRYFAGEPVGFEDIPLDPAGTDFQLATWAALGRIPYGEVRTYGELARDVGRPKAVRAIGAAVGRNPLPLLLPCHRVVGSNGALTGFRGGLRLKQRLLSLEGAPPLKDAGHERFRF
ncbi:methylated-DNA--[protein]-cysteine S-methyltransferase [Paenibacillus sp.]|uniref:methylated-DNA--[protein]-cysteine S-methyltransferase n=1 Tax=Paenibacillus sp. TaxID=58172 RepID=UPI002D3EC4B7|nr:methylated-DNA--[protein]-cysteine S-methyltransferase [Paenibacillus sp.]HZG84768.1 methylated-DNA--[protein]-cysteine S-methyltransferase [Paenibacillus sp.]